MTGPSQRNDCPLDDSAHLPASRAGLAPKRKFRRLAERLIALSVADPSPYSRPQSTLSRGIIAKTAVSWPRYWLPHHRLLAKLRHHGIRQHPHDAILRRAPVFPVDSVANDAAMPKRRSIAAFQAFRRLSRRSVYRPAWRTGSRLSRRLGCLGSRDCSSRCR